eukprot:TRINITY_DN9687_c0_g8_i1.p1 TRINITY_DN9687_c0_g8~~TRINITY_DN9687_c0_g8_i1.p1  ORF type:complete len:199 (-),score=41.71 TRINITY_DN9687_c0_g8_i1:162-758(-)
MKDAKYEPWELIARPLNQILSNSLGQVSMSKNALTCFDFCELPNITFQDYLARVRKYIKCSDSCFILAFIYIDRVLQNNKFIILSNRNIHRLFLAAFVLAIKYWDDVHSRNIVYAKVGCVTLSELNVLVGCMLSMLDYRVHVSPQVYLQYADELLMHSLKMDEQAMNEVSSEGLKPLRQIGSTESIKTTFSFNDMEET